MDQVLADQQFAMHTFRDPRHVAALMLFLHAGSLSMALGGVFLLALLNRLLHSRWLACAAWIGVFVALSSPGLRSSSDWRVALPLAPCAGHHRGACSESVRTPGVGRDPVYDRDVDTFAGRPRVLRLVREPVADSVRRCARNRRVRRVLRTGSLPASARIPTTSCTPHLTATELDERFSLSVACGSSILSTVWAVPDLSFAPRARLTPFASTARANAAVTNQANPCGRRGPVPTKNFISRYRDWWRTSGRLVGAVL